MAFSILDKYTVNAPTIEGTRNKKVIDITVKRSPHELTPKNSLKIRAYRVGMPTTTKVLIKVLFMVFVLIQ